MKKQYRLLIFCMLAVCLISAACMGFHLYWTPPNLAPLMIAPTDYGEAYQKQAKLCYTFVAEKMISPEGGVYTNFLDTDQKSDFASGHDVLLESQSLLMLYAAYQDDRPLFNQAYSYIRNHLQQKEFISWRFDSLTGQASDVNAAIDDLRFLRALLYGSTKWQDKDLLWETRRLADKLYRTNVVDGRLVDMYDGAQKLSPATITLCYLDLHTLYLLSEISGKWAAVYQNALQTVQNGYLGDAFPLYQNRFRYDSGAYEQGSLNLTEGLITVYHLAEIGELRHETVQWLKARVAERTLYTRYDLDGSPESEIQSTAAYAVSAIIGALLRDQSLYRDSVRAMNLYQVDDPASEIYGAYGEKARAEAYSFDNLYALLSFCY